MTPSIGSLLWKVSAAGLLVLLVAGYWWLPLAPEAGWHRFAQPLFEPSGATPLPDGSVLVVEDEQDQPLWRITLERGGSVKATPLPLAPQTDFPLPDDLEGATQLGGGQVVLLSSHSRTFTGKQRPQREVLTSFHAMGNQVAHPTQRTNLLPHLTQRFPFLNQAAQVAFPKDPNAFNMEGLAYLEGSGQLLLGFRAPLDPEGRALVIPLTNPREVLGAGQPPQFAEPIWLDLGGEGIRDLEQVPYLGGGVLVVSGPAGEPLEDRGFHLWHWSGKRGAPPQRLRTPRVEQFGATEGLAPIRDPDGREWLLLVADDGNPYLGISGSYRLLDPRELLPVRPTP